MQTLSYKTHQGSCELSTEDGCFHGHLRLAGDLVTYESATEAGMQKEFEAAVDDYLTTCGELGMPPNPGV